MADLRKYGPLRGRSYLDIRGRRCYVAEVSGFGVSRTYHDGYQKLPDGPNLTFLLSRESVSFLKKRRAMFNATLTLEAEGSILGAYRFAAYVVDAIGKHATLKISGPITALGS